MPLWMRPGWFLCTILQTVSLATGCARAGQIGVHCAAACVISVGGRIEDGDDRTFHDLAAARNLTGAQPGALVALSGPGGKVAPALAIGREIRALGLRTLVPAGASCASACALIWLGGTQRSLGTDARIGFHALSAARAGAAPTETHEFDAGLVRYLTELGYAHDVTATIVNTPAILVHWRDAIELNANGIATQNDP